MNESVTKLLLLPDYHMKEGAPEDDPDVIIATKTMRRNLNEIRTLFSMGKKIALGFEGFYEAERDGVYDGNSGIIIPGIGPLSEFRSDINVEDDVRISELCGDCATRITELPRKYAKAIKADEAISQAVYCLAVENRSLHEIHEKVSLVLNELNTISGHYREMKNTLKEANRLFKGISKLRSEHFLKSIMRRMGVKRGYDTVLLISGRHHCEHISQYLNTESYRNIGLVHEYIALDEE